MTKESTDLDGEALYVSRELRISCSQAARFAALVIIIELGVAFLLVHNLKLSGPGNGEVAFIYLAGLVAIFLAGAGRFSVDGKM